MLEFPFPNKLYIIKYIPILIQKIFFECFFLLCSPILLFWGGSKVQPCLLNGFPASIGLYFYFVSPFAINEIFLKLINDHVISSGGYVNSFPLASGKPEHYAGTYKVVIISLHHKCSTPISYKPLNPYLCLCFHMFVLRLSPPGGVLFLLNGTQALRLLWDSPQPLGRAWARALTFFLCSLTTLSQPH